jgi:hypothetical protein
MLLRRHSLECEMLPTCGALAGPLKMRESRGGGEHGDSDRGDPGDAQSARGALVLRMPWLAGVPRGTAANYGGQSASVIARGGHQLSGRYQSASG